MARRSPPRAAGVASPGWQQQEDGVPFVERGDEPRPQQDPGGEGVAGAAGRDQPAPVTATASRATATVAATRTPGLPAGSPAARGVDQGGDQPGARRAGHLGVVGGRAPEGRRPPGVASTLAARSAPPVRMAPAAPLAGPATRTTGGGPRPGGGAREGLTKARASKAPARASRQEPRRGVAEREGAGGGAQEQPRPTEGGEHQRANCPKTRL